MVTTVSFHDPRSYSNHAGKTLLFPQPLVPVSLSKPHAGVLEEYVLEAEALHHSDTSTGVPVPTLYSAPPPEILIPTLVLIPDTVILFDVY